MTKLPNIAWYFLTGMVIVYLLIFLLSPVVFGGLAQLFLKLSIELIPALVALYALIFFINLLLGPRKITRHLGKGSGLRGLLIATTAGIISTGPIYAWYPLLANLREKGMTDNLITIFLYNRAVIIPLLPMTIYYFGLEFTITLTALMIAFSVLNGWLVGSIIGNETNDLEKCNMKEIEK
jgi:uncharacterized membrane protein YraQ (UPF0718 family)